MPASKPLPLQAPLGGASHMLKSFTSIWEGGRLIKKKLSWMELTLEEPASKTSSVTCNRPSLFSDLLTSSSICKRCTSSRHHCWLQWCLSSLGCHTGPVMRGSWWLPVLLDFEFKIFKAGFEAVFEIWIFKIPRSHHHLLVTTSLSTQAYELVCKVASWL